MSPTPATAARIVRSRLPDVDIPDTSVTDCTFRAAPDDTERVAIIDGVAPNNLTGSFQRDRFAGTPWHKTVPARLEPFAAP